MCLGVVAIHEVYEKWIKCYKSVREKIEFELKVVIW